MPLSIGEVARLTGLTIHTLRYYDDCGLLPQVERADNGHRRFDEDDLGWIEILKCLRATDMPLADMQRFTQLVAQGPSTAGQRRDLLEAHRRMVEARQRETEAALARIDEKIKHYREMTREQPSLVATSVAERDTAAGDDRADA